MALSQAIFPAILRDAGVALLLVNSTGRIHYANAAALAQVARRVSTPICAKSSST